MPRRAGFVVAATSELHRRLVALMKDCFGT